MHSKHTPNSSPRDTRTRVFVGIDAMGRPHWGRAVIRPEGLAERIARCRRGEASPLRLLEVVAVDGIEISDAFSDLPQADR